MVHKASVRTNLSIFIAILALAFAIFLLLITPPQPATGSEPSSTILINEVMYDPDGSDTGYEWIELKNVSSEPVDIKSWSIQIAGKYFITKFYFDPYVIQPGKIILVGENQLSGLDILTTTLSLPNGGSETDGIRVLDKYSNVVDTILYDAPNINELLNDDHLVTEDTAPDVAPGHSLARISDTDTNNSAADFVESTEPTPGEENAFPPVPNLNIPDPVFINSVITLDASWSYDLDGTIEEYSWTITSPSASDKSLTGATPEYVFEEIGTYTISLTITDNDNLETQLSTDITTEEDPDNPIITPIAAVKNLDLRKTISIRATITAPLGVLYEDETYAQDRTGGIRIKVPEPLSPKISYDNSYIITGKTSSTYGEPRILVERLIPSSDHLSVKTQTVKPAALTEHFRGMLISTEIAVESSRGTYFYSAQLPNGITPTIYIPQTIDIEIPAKETYHTIRVTGIVSQYGTLDDGSPKLRIMPRIAEDITFISSGSVLASTGIAIVPGIAYGVSLFLLIRAIVVTNRF